MPPSKKRPAGSIAPGLGAGVDGGSSRGFSASRHGMKKQKLAAQSAELRANTKKAKDIASLVRAKQTKLAAKKTVAREGNARIPYNRHMHYLTIGEGNFSFTRALVQHFVQQAKQAEKQTVGTAEAAAAAAAAAAEAAEIAAEEEADDASGGAGGAAAGAAGGRKWNRKKEGSFDPQVHVPMLPPNTLFTNPEVRVVATCYDSFKELLFKYSDVTTPLAYLAAQRIPVYTGVDCLHLDSTRRAGRAVSAAAIRQAQRQEAERKVENDALRKARREKEDAEDEAGIEAQAEEQDEEEKEAEEEEEEEQAEEDDAAAAAASSDPATAELLAPRTSPLLFPPFITRRAFHAAQAAAEKRLHGSQRKKLKERRGRELDEFKAEQESAAAALSADGKSASAASAPAVKGGNSGRAPTTAQLRQQQRALSTDVALRTLNGSAPRTRFHRIIFQFPHTGCGLKDTEANNAVHREFLGSFMKHLVSTRLLYPASKHGELHITLKRGEPYTSWNLIGLAKRTPGLTFKTCFPFYTHLYPGYEHRRTRGFEQDREMDMATGAVLGPNSDISGSGSMTYVFTRDDTQMDEEEQRADELWAKKYGQAREEEEVRKGLLVECDRIYRETAQRHGQQGQHTGSKRQKVEEDEEEEDEEMGEEEEAAADEEQEEAADDEEADEVDDEEDEEQPAAQGENEDEDESFAPVPDLAAALRMHFQPRAAAAPTKLQQQQLVKKYGKPAGKQGKRK